jgi:hypothetical protein
MANIFMMNEEIARGMVCFFHQKKHSYLIFVLNSQILISNLFGKSVFTKVIFNFSKIRLAAQPFGSFILAIESAMRILILMWVFSTSLAIIDKSASPLVYNLLPGIDFTKLHFGQKLFESIFILKLWTKSMYCGHQSWFYKAIKNHNYKLKHGQIRFLSVNFGRNSFIESTPAEVRTSTAAPILQPQQDLQRDTGTVYDNKKMIVRNRLPHAYPQVLANK